MHRYGVGAAVVEGEGETLGVPVAWLAVAVRLDVGVAEAGNRDCEMDPVGENVALRLTVGETRVGVPLAVSVGIGVAVDDALVAAGLGLRDAVADSVGVTENDGVTGGVTDGVGAKQLSQPPAGQLLHQPSRSTAKQFW